MRYAASAAWLVVFLAACAPSRFDVTDPRPEVDQRTPPYELGTSLPASDDGATGAIGVGAGTTAGTLAIGFLASLLGGGGDSTSTATTTGL